MLQNQSEHIPLPVVLPNNFSTRQRVMGQSVVDSCGDAIFRIEEHVICDVRFERQVSAIVRHDFNAVDPLEKITQFCQSNEKTETRRTTYDDGKVMRTVESEEDAPARDIAP